MFEQYAAAIATASPDQIRADSSLGSQLDLERDGAITISYAPFDYVNSMAKIVLVGITPGRQQAINALIEARRVLAAGGSHGSAIKAAKETASFSGSMRPNLVGLLDAIGLQRVLDIPSCLSLFSDRTDLVHYTSALRYPVYVAGQNYSGQPDMIRTPLLRSQVERYLGSEVATLRESIWVPLGPKPAAALFWLAKKDVLSPELILDGLPHPSGANAERIAYFLGRKSRLSLSPKTNADTLDAAKAALLAKVEKIKPVV